MWRYSELPTECVVCTYQVRNGTISMNLCLGRRKINKDLLMKTMFSDIFQLLLLVSNLCIQGGKAINFVLKSLGVYFLQVVVLVLVGGSI